MINDESPANGRAGRAASLVLADPAAVPARKVLASVRTYDEAVRMVDALSDRGFPVARVSIVARDLSFVERVTGRETTGRAALRTAAAGVAFGGLLGFFLGLLGWRDPVESALILAVYGALLGAVVGALVGAVGHAARGGQRDFASVGTMQADAYEVLVEDAWCEEARALLKREGSGS